MQKVLEKLGLSDKESAVYIALLRMGPSSLRRVSGEIDINRGTTYDALKALTERGLVAFHDKDKKRRYIAESPDVLINIIRDRRRDVVRAKRELDQIMPELQALSEKSVERPSVRLYEGEGGAKTILEDVIKVVSMESPKEYYVYSSLDVREYLYKDFASFSERRITAKIKVKAVALGAGGELRGLDERRWIRSKEESPAYMIIYGPKVAIFSLAEGRYLTSVLIHDPNLAETQKTIFKTLWNSLPSKNK